MPQCNPIPLFYSPSIARTASLFHSTYIYHHVFHPCQLQLPIKGEFSDRASFFRYQFLIEVEIILKNTHNFRDISCINLAAWIDQIFENTSPSLVLPKLASNIDKRPVPEPSSRTRFPLKSIPLLILLTKYLLSTIA